MLEQDPSEDFYPEHIPLKTPRPLFAGEQERCWRRPERRTSARRGAVWLMLHWVCRVPKCCSSVTNTSISRMPVNRSFTSTMTTSVIADESAGWPQPRVRPAVPRCWGVGSHGPVIWDLAAIDEQAGGARGARGWYRAHVSPQTLRDTFAVDRAREGASEEELLGAAGTGG